jgi:hypothetical protein
MGPLGEPEQIQHNVLVAPAGTTDETLVQLVHKRCMTISTGRITEGARCMT